MNIQTKLILIILLASAVMVSALYFLLQWNVDRGVLNYVNQRQLDQYQTVKDSLEAHFLEHGSWQVFVEDRHAFNDLITELDPEDRHSRRSSFRRGQEAGPRGDRGPGGDRGPRGEHRPERGGPPPEFRGPPPGRERHRGRMGRSGVGLLDRESALVVGTNYGGPKLPLTVNGNIEGWLVLRKSDDLIDDYELDFFEQLQETFLLTCLVIFALSLAIGFPLGRHLTRPVALLEKSTARLASGDFNQRIELQRSDEFGSLQRSFNELAATLQQSDDSRKRWLADTSHELRTPLSVVRAQIEAMIDDVRPLNKQELGIALAQISHLQKLMDDLHELSNADIGGLRYSKASVNLAELIEQSIEQHQGAFAERNIDLKFEDGHESAIFVHADASRIQQLLSNLFSNSLKYTSKNGVTKVACSIDTEQNCAVLTIDDSEPGVAETEHAKLFEHLYRVEDSRSRSSGGSGLGLAICKRIVEAHNGQVTASASKLGGLRIEILLPVQA